MLNLNSAFVMLGLADVEDHFRRHGAGLAEILNIVGGEIALDLFCEVRERVDDSVPDTKKIHENLIRMQSILAQADNPGPRYLQALCWHGARLGDLAARVA